MDFVTDRRTKAPATAACELAWERAIDLGMIVQFGGSGANVLKFKPPLTTPPGDFAQMLERCETLTAFIQGQVEKQRAAAR